VSRALAAFAARSEGAGEWQVEQVQEMAGRGLVAMVRQAGQGGSPWTVRLGSAAHAGVASAGMQQQVVLACERTERGGRPEEIARFDLNEDLRPEAAEVVRGLQQAGVAVQLLSGDRNGSVQRVAAQAGIAEAVGDCTPQDKLRRLQAAQAQGRHVAMVGDGLNDGPVLAGAHVSFAFGRAVPLAQSRSDFVVLGDRLDLVLQSLLLARRTLRIVRQNLWWAAGYNALCVPLAIAGYMPAWLAGLGMALSSLLVVMNAARLTRGAAAMQPGSPARPASALAAATPVEVA